MMRFEIVHPNHIPGAQVRNQAVAHPGDKRDGIGRAPWCRQGDPAREPHRADHRQVVPPMHRARLDIRRAALHPHVRSSHRHIGPSLIEKDETGGINPADTFQECHAFGLDLRTIEFARPMTCFLYTKPARASARRRLDSLVRAARGTRRLYFQHNSPTVSSGIARTTARSTSRSMGEVWPPPLGYGAKSPVQRYAATQRCKVRYPMRNTAANSWYPPSPALYARTARSRNAKSYGSAMRTLKYSSCVNSTAVRG